MKDMEVFERHSRERVPAICGVLDVMVVPWT